MSRKCYLQCFLNQTKRIILPEKENVILGRNEFTGIQDLGLSRKQLECRVNFDPDELIVKPIGTSYVGCNGYALMFNETYHLKHGDILELLLGTHKFKIIFEENGELQKVKFHPLFKVEKRRKKGGTKVFGKWESIDENELLIFTPENCVVRSKIAAFDLDGTLIKTRSGARFPKDKDDWEININVVPKKLHELHESNYKIVIFTNQSGVGNNRDKINDFKEKIAKIVTYFNVPIQVFISLGRGIYRKPAPGMWDSLNCKNQHVEIDISQSFYVGDAAGREKDWAPKKKKDHSCSDRLFAINLDLKFHTPEEYFLKSPKIPFKMPSFNPRNLPTTPYPNFQSDKLEVVLMVGCQGSGKSHFCENELKNYVHINRDKLKTWEKCVRTLEEALCVNKSAVIDNTNPDKNSRRKYLEVAKKFNVQCRCFVMNVPFEQCRHNNRFRELTNEQHDKIPDMLLFTYRKYFDPPEMNEGFDEIVEIPFKPYFKSTKDEELYKLFLLN